MSPRAAAYLLYANLIGGAAYAAAAYALPVFSPLALVFWRTAAAAVLFLPFLSFKKALGYSREDWLRMAAVGVLGYAAPLWVGTLGQKLSSAANASLLVGVEPVSIVLLSSVFLGEPLTGLKAGSIGCGLLGAGLIVARHAGRALTPSFVGDLILFGHGFLWSLYTVFAKPTLKRVDTMAFSAWTTLIGFAALAAAAAFTGVRPFAPVTTASIVSLAFLAAAVQFGGIIAWNRGLELVPASQLANFIFLQPLFGVALAVFLQGERLGVLNCVGGALIVASVYGASKEPEAQGGKLVPSAP